MRPGIVTGDRHADWSAWCVVVDDALLAASVGVPQLVVIHGAASGIDAIANRVVDTHRGMVDLPLPGQWTTHGKAAGPMRNDAMLKMLMIFKEHGYDVQVMAFHDDLDGSKGTKDMVGRARRAGVPVSVFTTKGT